MRLGWLYNREDFVLKVEKRGEERKRAEEWKRAEGRRVSPVFSTCM